MAAPRSTQAHQKRVQKIAAEAADKIAAEAPFEEDVVVVVEELPPGEPARTQRGRSPETERDTTDAALGMVAQAQKLVADGINQWIDLVTTSVGTSAASMEAFGGVFNPRHVIQETFRLAEELLSSQKQIALKVAEVLTPAKAA